MTTTQWIIFRPETVSQSIWRYLTYDKFEDLLLTSSIYLRRLDKLFDMHEGKLDSHTTNKISYLFQEYPNSGQMQMQLFNLLNLTKTITFINC